VPGAIGAQDVEKRLAEAAETPTTNWPSPTGRTGTPCPAAP